jgi:hypothetical protein
VGCLTLLGLPLAGVGLFLLYLTTRTLWFAYEVGQWTETPAIIVGAKLEAHRGKSTTWEAKATYRYTVAGATYTGTRVAIHTGSDNIGSFQRSAYAELKKYEASGAPFRCYVNPRDPAESILFRDPRWEFILFKGAFGLVFGGVGCGMLAGALWTRRQARAQAAGQASHPAEPWLWNPAWSSGVIKSSGKAEMVVALLFAIFWNAIALPASILALTGGSLRDEPVRLMVLILPAVGIGLAAWAVLAVLRYRKYGVSTFRMPKIPGLIGGPLGGVVQVPAHVKPLDGFRVNLKCIHRYTTGTGKNRSTHEDTLWEAERLMAHELCENDPSRSAIPVLFGIPMACEPTRTEPADDQILWRLSVKARTPGPDYASEFEVPVFVTPESSASFHVDENPIAKYAARIDPHRVWRDAHVVVTPTASGTSYYFPPARHIGQATMATIFAAGWSGIVAAMCRFGAPLFLTIVFGLIDLAVLWGMLVLWLDWRRLEIRSQDLTVSGGVLGLGRTRVLPREKVADVTAEPGLRSGNRTYYNLKLRTAAGRSITIGPRIIGKHAADLMATEITEALKSSPTDAY